MCTFCRFYRVPLFYFCPMQEADQIFRSAVWLLDEMMVKDAVLVSDIAHQMKTPIANLKMVNAMFLEEPVPKVKQKEFLQAVGAS